MRKVIIFVAFLSVLLSLPDSKAEPKKQFFPNFTFDNFVTEWYIKHLQVMNEPSLFEISRDINSHSYRFLWLRTFHPPIAVRLKINSNGSGVLAVKTSDGRGGFETGSLVTNESIEITKKQVDGLVSKIEEMRFWGLQTREKLNPNVIGTDGASWVFEGVKNGTYHVVKRQSPEEGIFRETGLMLVKFAKLTITEVY